MRDTLTERLIECLEKTATDDWPWFETILSYDNAKLPHALIASGRSSGNAKAVSLGTDSLKWLVERQKSPTGFFRSIGSNGFYPKNGERAQFDQQPIEAHATVAACIEAYHATDDPSWLQEARLAFEWFLGGNDLGLDLYDAKSGGCYDGLQEDRVNINQGAEFDPGISAGAGGNETSGGDAGDFPSGAGQLSWFRRVTVFGTYASLDTEVRSKPSWNRTDR